jgi:hypothetical protein
MYTSYLILFIREPKQTEERHQPCQSSINRKSAGPRSGHRGRRRAKEMVQVEGAVATNSNRRVIWFSNLLGTCSTYYAKWELSFKEKK